MKLLILAVVISLMTVDGVRRMLRQRQEGELGKRPFQILVTMVAVVVFELLFARVSRRSNRPLLKTADPRATLRELMQRRYPIYGEADITVVTRDVPHEQVTTDVVDAILSYLDGAATRGGHDS